MRDNLLINKNPLKILDSPQPQKMWFQHAGDMLTEIYRSLGSSVLGKRRDEKQGDDERLAQVPKVNEFSIRDNADCIGEVAYFIGTEIGISVMEKESQFTHDLQNDRDLINTVIYNVLLRLRENKGEIVLYPIRLVYENMDKFTIKEISLDYKKKFSLMVHDITMHSPLVSDEKITHLDGHFNGLENKTVAKIYKKYKQDAYEMAQIAAFLWVCISEFLQLQNEYLKIKGWLETTLGNFMENMEIELNEVNAKLSKKGNNVVFTLKGREFELTTDNREDIDTLIDNIFITYHKISKEDTPRELAESAPPLAETSSAQSAETLSAQSAEVLSTQSAETLSTPHERKSSARMSSEAMSMATPSSLQKPPTGKIPKPTESPLNSRLLERMSIG